METKNYFITLLLSLFCIPMNAQLKVLSNGKVGIGTTNPQYGCLEIGKSGVNHRLRKLSEMAEKVRQKQGGLL